MQSRRCSRKLALSHRRQSKITTFVDGRLKNVDLSSYVSAGVTSNSNHTDSQTLRLRQAWAQAKFDSRPSLIMDGPFSAVCGAW